jgi:hypothetical protein
MPLIADRIWSRARSWSSFSILVLKTRISGFVKDWTSMTGGFGVT